ncbi:hypothetical protein A2448_02415 [Candidatus Peregrinibacteria bacterium RIFOXYC2_FULL_41_22]|nr:MAG: hypothetical protein A2448_02415 [Candidatus Peregrinibacteria bacterium RIFOXYC2_FULL_41_22]
MVLSLAVLSLSSCASNNQVQGDSCESTCEQISGMCADVTPEACKEKCNNCGGDVLDEIKSETDCGKIEEKISQCLFTEETGNNCDAACNNYNSQCLSLVPTVNQELLDQGYSSCMEECKSWDGEKTTCMETAQDCPSMTEVCGL